MLDRRTHISRFFIVPRLNWFHGNEDKTAFDKINGFHLFSAFENEEGQLFLEGNYYINDFYLSEAAYANGDIVFRYPIWQNNNLITHIGESLRFVEMRSDKIGSMGNGENFITPMAQTWVEQVGQFLNVILKDTITRLDVILFIGSNILGIIPDSEIQQLREQGWNEKMKNYISNTLDFIIQGEWRISCDITFPEIVDERGFKNLNEVFI